MLQEFACQYCLCALISVRSYSLMKRATTLRGTLCVRVWNFGVKALATVFQRGSSMFRSPLIDPNDNLRIKFGPLQIFL
jgi:hypothetical protein